MSFSITSETPMIDAGLILAGVGFRVVWLHRPTDGKCSCGREACDKNAGKHPVHRSWPTTATNNPDELRDQHRALKFTPNIGLVMGEQPDGRYLVAVDVDDADRLAELEAEHGSLPPTLRCTSGRGERRFFSIPAGTPTDRIKNVTGLGEASGVDVKAKGGQVAVGPSLHPNGKHYEWVEVRDVATLPPAWVLALLAPPQPPQWIREYTPQQMRADAKAQRRAEKYFEKAVTSQASIVAGIGEGARNSTLHKSAFALGSLANGMMIAGGFEYVARELRRAARACGLPDVEAETAIRNGLEGARKSGAMRTPQLVESWAKPEPAPDPVDEPSIDLIIDRGEPAKCAENVARLLSQHPDWRGGPRFDRYHRKVCWPHPLPGPVAGLDRTGRQLAEADAMAVQGWLLGLPERMRVRVGSDIARDGIALASQRAHYDALEEYAATWPAWDGVDRLTTVLTAYWGVEDSLYARAIGRAWLVGAVARVFQPGCAQGPAPIFEGVQGSGKNLSIDTLFGRDWVRSLGSYRVGESIDADRIASSTWILHDDEFAVSRGALVRVKAWLTRLEDTYRLPYAREMVTVARRGVYVASTNETEYLEDDENRRFAPLATSSIDVPGIARDRLQILAQALHAYRSGEDWILRRDHPAWAEAVAHQQDRRVRDDLETMIGTVLREKLTGPTVRTADLAVWLGVQPKDAGKAWTMRAAQCLKNLGFTRRKVRVDGVPQWAFARSQLLEDGNGRERTEV